MDSKYYPISCTLHDELESLATLQKKVTIVYSYQEQHILIEDRIKDIITEFGAEYMILSGGTKIRLDAIIECDGRTFTNSYC
jgi:transcriptional antiterminator Rof (Rho-off)